MADKEISMLPQVDSINEETKFPVYNPNALNPAQHATGAQLAAFAREGGAAAMETEGRPLVEAAAASAALAAESARQAAEQMEDVRTGYDGTVYPTAGEAVRRQIGAFGKTPIVKRKNLINPSAITTGGWYYNGKFEMYPDNPYVGGYGYTDYIPVVGGEKYVYSGGHQASDGSYKARMHSFSYLDKDKGFISSTIAPFDGGYIGDYYVFDVPENASYIIINVYNDEMFYSSKPQLEKGEVPTEYEEYIPDDELTGYYLPDLRVSMKQIEDFSLPETEDNLLRLPDKYHLVVGDSFELFYKGIINAVNPYLFDVVITCTKGNAYSKRFIYTPVSGDVGTHTLSIELYDYTRKLVGEGSVKLVVSAKASSPASNINVLCVGDSLTTGGVWPKEFHRRLVASDGTPAGDNLRNISFVGTRQYGDVRYEGYGGWRFNHYNTANVSTNAKVITCTHDKTEADDQHSVYKDSTGAHWKLETIENGSIKILAVTGEGANFPATGTLTWVSGGKNHSNIVYTAAVNGPGNPFWNSDTGMVDFAKYAEGLGVTRIDYVYVLLGWNDAGTSDETYTQDAQTFIDNVHKAFPNCKIILMGLQIPARDGLGNNYGANGIYSRYYDLMQHVFRLDRIYAALSENNDNVYSFNLSGQFDTENNSITATRPVNARNPKVETYQSNGVHPDGATGSMQIADACYRDFIRKLQ